jgi:hypothetical protein
METIGKKTGLAARNVLNLLACPEGFEPPTPRSVERSKHRLTRIHLEKKSETQAEMPFRTCATEAKFLPVPHSPVATW